jgi:hypothetical protein
VPSAAHASTKRRSIQAASSPVARRVCANSSLSGDRLEPVAGEVDEEEQAEIVPQLAVDAVVVEEVAEDWPITSDGEPV